MQINSDFEFIIKLIIIGDSGVGKTNFIFRFTEGKFSPLHVTTVGFDFKYRIVKLPKSKKNVKITIYDTAGQERYMALNKNLFQKVQGIILMYDITNRDSFDNLNKWLNLVTQSVSQKTIILVGNKTDLANEKRIVSEEEAESLAKENNILFFEGSGCTGENVDNIFKTIGDIIYTKLMEDRNDNLNNSSLELKSIPKAKKKRC